MKNGTFLRGISLALALAVAPGLAFGQSDIIKRKNGAGEAQPGASGSGAGGGEQQMTAPRQEKGTGEGIAKPEQKPSVSGGAETQGQVKSGEGGSEKMQQGQTKSGEGGSDQMRKGMSSESTGSGQVEEKSTTGTSDSGTSASGTKSGSSGSAEGGKSGGNVEVNISSTQRTEVKQVIEEEHVQPVEHVSFQVSVGVAVPQKIELHPLPPRIIKIVPEYADYEYFVLADGRIIIVDPNSYEVVYIIS